MGIGVVLVLHLSCTSQSPIVKEDRRFRLISERVVIPCSRGDRIVTFQTKYSIGKQVVVAS
jgi:hypothetical protein